MVANKLATLTDESNHNGAVMVLRRLTHVLNLLPPLIRCCRRHSGQKQVRILPPEVPPRPWPDWLPAGRLYLLLWGWDAVEERLVSNITWLWSWTWNNTHSQSFRSTWWHLVCEHHYWGSKSSTAVFKYDNNCDFCVFPHLEFFTQGFRHQIHMCKLRLDYYPYTVVYEESCLWFKLVYGSMHVWHYWLIICCVS